jgi:cyclic pyranopterin phosphate synthase
MIFNYKPDIDLAMTTNGYLLDETAERLKEAGLKRLNISLDSMKPETAKKIAQKDVLEKVLKGIDKSLEVGLKVKLNTVPLKNINDDEILDILEFAKSKNVVVRFIEFMENSFAKQNLTGLTSKEILEIIATKYKFKDTGIEPGSPSHYYQLEDGYKFGIIEPHRDDFCENCNRIRLTAEGFLIPCLYFDEALSIKKAIKNGDLSEATEVLKTVIKNKPEKNRWSGAEQEESSRAFYHTGG